MRIDFDYISNNALKQLKKEAGKLREICGPNSNSDLQHFANVVYALRDLPEAQRQYLSSSLFSSTDPVTSGIQNVMNTDDWLLLYRSLTDLVSDAYFTIEDGGSYRLIRVQTKTGFEKGAEEASFYILSAKDWSVSSIDIAKSWIAWTPLKKRGMEIVGVKTYKMIKIYMLTELLESVKASRWKKNRMSGSKINEEIRFSDIEEEHGK